MLNQVINSSSLPAPLLPPAALSRLIAPAGRRRHAALGRVPHQSAGQQRCVCVPPLAPRRVCCSALTPGQGITSAVPYMVTPGNHEIWYNFSAYKTQFWTPVRHASLYADS